MPELKLYCDRPHEKTIDFSAARLVVATAHGLNVNGRMLAMGEEVPQGALPADALRMEYETPLRRLELLEYAMKDPDLRDAVVRHRQSGSSAAVEQAEPSPAPVPAPAPAKARERKDAHLDLDAKTMRELAKICRDYKLSDRGSKLALQHRIRTHLGQ
jgi:hypothetical protein